MDPRPQWNSTTSKLLIFPLSDPSLWFIWLHLLLCSLKWVSYSLTVVLEIEACSRIPIQESLSLPVLNLNSNLSTHSFCEWIHTTWIVMLIWNVLLVHCFMYKSLHYHKFRFVQPQFIFILILNDRNSLLFQTWLISSTYQGRTRRSIILLECKAWTEIALLLKYSWEFSFSWSLSCLLWSKYGSIQTSHNNINEHNNFPHSL